MRSRTVVPIFLSFLVILATAIIMSVLVSKMFKGHASGNSTSGSEGPTDTTILQPTGDEGAIGSWQLLLQNAGIASMHTGVTHLGNVIMLDRTNIGASQINLPNGMCRDSTTELTLKHDCTAHSVVFTPGPNTVRPLFIQTDTWCSSGQFLSDGSLVQTGGDFEGLYKVRHFRPCASSGTCDWEESTTEFLRDGRWYATNQILPDGLTQIIVGGRNVFTYEFIPNPSKSSPKFLPFLKNTNDLQGDNLYPFVHLLPDGTLFIFANRDSIILNYNTNQVLKTFPTIPGEPRNYPSAGSSVMLPLKAENDFNNVEILVCGGAQYGAFLNSSLFLPASQSCGRIAIFSKEPSWEMETMPLRRTMGEMLLLPTQDVLIINGAQNGCQGWGNAKNAALNPVIYHPMMPTNQRFAKMAPTTIARVYHSTSNLLPDGRILVAGSNTHQFYTLSGEFPTELRLEAFLPPYLSPTHNNKRPTILEAPNGISYNQKFVLKVSINMKPQTMQLSLMSAPFSTHSFSQGQRLLSLKMEPPVVDGHNIYVITATSPPKPTIAPPAYYMLFVVNDGVPSDTAKWINLYN